MLLGLYIHLLFITYYS